MDRDQQRFFKQILRSVMNAAITRTMWGLPLGVVILIGVAAAAGLWFLK